MPLVDLPTVINAPGDYVTRAGQRVTIHAIQGPSTFAAKGSLWKVTQGKASPKGYDIWHTSGRYKAVGQSPEDILSPWSD